MAFEGWISSAAGNEIRGWVYLESNPDGVLDVEIVADGQVIAQVPADIFEDHLKSAGKGNGAHGFSFRTDARSADSTPLRARVAGQRWFIQPCDYAFPRPYAMMKHSCEYGLPEGAPSGFSETPPIHAAQETALANRLLTAYHRAIATMPAAEPREDLWTLLERSIFVDFFDLLRRRDADGLAACMRNFFAKSISHGTYQGEHATAALQAAGTPVFVISQYVDYLASLAEAVGALRLESPESHGHYGENLYRDPEELVQSINDALKIELVPPNVAGQKFGLRTSSGILGSSDIRAAYAAFRIRELIGSNPNPSVCEIGGGIGGAAFYCWQMGIRNYTIIDLPHIGLMQAYWLIRALPETPVILFSEPDPGGPAIRLLPPSSFGRALVDLVYNQDSFPEMHASHSLEYLVRAKEIAPALLSINQEHESPQGAGSLHTVVADLVSKAGGYRRAYRFPHWLRVGYVEELYVVESPPVRVRLRQLLRRLR